jgi:hypothetical protein
MRLPPAGPTKRVGATFSLTSTSVVNEPSPVHAHHVLLDRVPAPDVVRGEVRIGVADREAAQGRQVSRDVLLFAHDVRVTGDRHTQVPTPRAVSANGNV